MAEEQPSPPGLLRLVRRFGRTLLGAVHNRAELLAVEWQEEKARLMELLFWTVGLMFLAIMGLLLLTLTVIFLFPPEWRLYVTGGFTVLYFAAAAGACVAVRRLLKQEPFAETTGQIKKDRAWLESLK
jgi:uncharacterized membrane protein YqjE